MIEGLADALYGGNQSSTPAPAQQPTQSNEFYGADNAPEPGTLHTGEIFSDALSGALQRAVDAGQVELAQARELGVTLQGESSALGFTGADGERLWRDLTAAPVDARTAQAQRAESVGWLRETYGANAEAVLKAATQYARQTSPRLMASLAQHSVGNTLFATQTVVRAYERAVAQQRAGAER